MWIFTECSQGGWLKWHSVGNTSFEGEAKKEWILGFSRAIVAQQVSWMCVSNEPIFHLALLLLVPLFPPPHTLFTWFSRSVVSGSLLPHGLSLTRLFCPWYFPGKNTGVGCHFLLQGIFPPQGSNLSLLHWQVILYHLGSHQGSPDILVTKLNLLYE